jgi:Alpha/beta hydrolase family
MSRIHRPRRRTVGLVLLGIVALAVAAFAWYVQPQPLLPEAEASLVSTPDVTFTDAGDRLEWAPSDGDYDAALVFYPGGKVPAPAYGPAAQAIAGQGYLVIVPEMPFNLAVFDIDAAARAIEAHPEVETWALAGHSLGGSMAAQFLASHPDAARGIAFWASYAATDLSALDLEVVSAWGTLDAGAARMSGPEATAVVPAGSTFTPIEGGNHEQMGWYTGQPNDPPATISREEQQRQVVEATLGMLRDLAPAP